MLSRQSMLGPLDCHEAPVRQQAMYLLTIAAAAAGVTLAAAVLLTEEAVAPDLGAEVESHSAELSWSSDAA